MNEHPAITEMFRLLQEHEERFAPKPDDVVLLITHPSNANRIRATTGSRYLSPDARLTAGLPIETDDWHSLDHWTAVLHKQKAIYDRYRQQYRPVKAIYLAAREAPATPSPKNP